MNLLQMTAAALIAIGIPAVFLILIYMLDLHASSAFSLVLLSSLWGLCGGAGLAYLINSYLVVPLMRELRLDYALLYILFAPIVEELVKSFPLFRISRQARFTYFVDGVIYGFASGIGFSVAENFLYISRHPDVAIPLALTRAFSTCLMHGTATALIGGAVGRFRLRRPTGRAMITIGSVVVAIFIHSLFNTSILLFLDRRLLSALTAELIGLLGFGLTVLFVFLGLGEERQWLIDSLDQHMVDLVKADLTLQEQAWLEDILNQEAGITVAEVRASQRVDQLDDILNPITERFPEKAELMRRIVRQQAQIGIKRRIRDQSQQEKTRTRITKEIGRLEENTKKLRKEAGIGAMAYLECVFDQEHPSIGPCLEDIVILIEEEKAA